MKIQLLLLFTTAFAIYPKYVKVPVYWDEKDHEKNTTLVNNVAAQLSKALIFYAFEPIDAEIATEDNIPGVEERKKLRGFFHEFYCNEEEMNFKTMYFEKQLFKNIWFGDNKVEQEDVWQGMAIPFFYNSENKEQSSKALKEIEKLQKNLKGKVTLWKFIPQEEFGIKDPKDSSKQKQGTILEVYKNSQEMADKLKPETGFTTFADARKEKDSAYGFGNIGYEEVGAKKFVEEKFEKAVDEQTEVIQRIDTAETELTQRIETELNQPIENDAEIPSRFIWFSKWCTCSRRAKHSHKE